ncbi:FAD/NAD(P)-binding protein [Roseomonas elaeocarpi]|uniref:FAD/NAD(P)-binding protein n=1 Tax=Roseomonas elaeocarpi TaxID=907779 RepID=A0ABV6JU24_9PROT
MEHPIDVAIIGGGFTGAVLAILLQRRLDPSRRVCFFEPRPEGGQGVAYGTDDPWYLLNAPASGMSALSDTPEGFRDFLLAQDASGAEGTDLPGPVAEERAMPAGRRFAQRRLYGRYVAELLDGALRAPGARLEHRRVAVSDLRRDPAGGWRIEAGEAGARARLCILALGNAPAPRVPEGCEPAGAATTEDAVLLVGSGLTMADNVLSLLAEGHRGPIRVVSRHGWLPLPHPDVPAAEPWQLQPPPGATAVAGTMDGAADGNGATLLALMRWLRAEARRAEAAGVPWQAVMDAARGAAPGLWRGLSLAERRRFLRHGRSPWGQHRHRVAPSVSRALARAAAEEQLTIQAGRFRGCERGAGGLIARVVRRGDGAEEQLPVREVRLCTGVGQGRSWEAQAPTAAMLERGSIRLDPLGFGLDADPDSCAMPDREGRLTADLFAVGPCAAGGWWEITAVPEIRRQAEALVERLVAGNGPLAGPAD